MLDTNIDMAGDCQTNVHTPAQTALGSTPWKPTMKLYSNATEDIILPQIRNLISKDLSEPYSIYVYRYFLSNWPKLCLLAFDPEKEVENDLIGVVICKIEGHESRSTTTPPTMRGYIAMLAVDKNFRRRGVALNLIYQTIQNLAMAGADEIVLEAEESNKSAIRLYQRLGFLASKKLHRYYLNGSSAYRLVLPLEKLLYPALPETVRRFRDHDIGEEDVEDETQVATRGLSFGNNQEYDTGESTDSGDDYTSYGSPDFASEDETADTRVTGGPNQGEV